MKKFWQKNLEKFSSSEPSLADFSKIAGEHSTPIIDLEKVLLRSQPSSTDNNSTGVDGFTQTSFQYFSSLHTWILCMLTKCRNLGPSSVSKWCLCFRKHMEISTEGFLILEMDRTCLWKLFKFHYHHMHVAREPRNAESWKMGPSEAYMTQERFIKEKLA